MNETIEKLRFCISIQLYIAKKVQETELLQITRKFFYPTWWHLCTHRGREGIIIQRRSSVIFKPMQVC